MIEKPRKTRHAMSIGEVGRLSEVFSEDRWELKEWRFTDQDAVESALKGSGDLLHALALAYLTDVVRRKKAGIQGEFVSAMLKHAGTFGSLTPGMTRGVLNTLGGALYVNRQRFTSNRVTFLARYDPAECCVVCGRNMSRSKTLAAGIGWTCYRRVMETNQALEDEPWEPF